MPVAEPAIRSGAQMQRDPSPPFGKRGLLRPGIRAAARNLGWLLASRAVLAILSLVYLGIATHTLGVSDFGRFALISGAVQALATLVGFQTWQIIIQYGLAHAKADETGALQRLLRGCAALDLTSAMVGVVLSIMILEIWGESFSIKPDMMRNTLIFAVVQMLTIRSTALGILRLRDRFSLAALADSVTPIVRFVGAGLASIFMPTVEGFLLGWAAAEFFTALAYWVLVLRSGDLALIWRGRAPIRQVLAENPGIMRFALSTNASSTLGLSSKQFPLLLVGASAGVAAAGAFRLAAQLAQSLTKLSQLLARAAFPEIVRAVSTGGMQRMVSLMGRSVLISSIVAIFVFGIIALAARPSLSLLGGAAFSHAYPILVWLAAAGCVDLVTVGFEPLLMAANRAGTALAARLAATAVLFGASFVLTAYLGVIGVAIAVLLSALTMAILLGISIVRIVRRT